MNKPAKKTTKKPAVIAKTAAKKRGRPVGSKNKSKSFEEKPFFVDWEKLAKQLQAALASEIKQGDDNQASIHEMAEQISRLCEEICRTRTFYERLVCLFTGKV